VDRVVVKAGDAVVIGTATHTFARRGKGFTTPMVLRLTVEDRKIVRLHLVVSVPGA
jgi:hypothetical protein